jgi:hypothetical protein
MLNVKHTYFIKNKASYAQDGYSPISGRSVNTANPPKGGSGVPPKRPVENSLDKK